MRKTLNIWAPLVNTNFRSCKIDVNEYVLQNMKYNWKVNICWLEWAGCKVTRELRVIAQKSPKPAMFCSAVKWEKQSSLWDVLLEKCSQTLQEMTLLIFRTPARTYPRNSDNMLILLKNGAGGGGGREHHNLRISIPRSTLYDMVALVQAEHHC